MGSEFNTIEADNEAEEHLASPRRQEAAALPASAGDVT